MDAEIIILHLAVFAAAALQAATGIGFGIIAGPIILISLNDGSAIQVSILLNILIAVVLAPTLFRNVDQVLLPKFAAGTVIGLPLGMIVFLFVSVDALKLMAGGAVFLVALLGCGLIGGSAANARSSESRIPDLGFGLLSGAMSTSLGMPGPVIAARMMALNRPKAVTRATIIALFVFSYSAAIAVQAASAGVAVSTLKLSAILAPATLWGVAVGKLIAERISEAMFRRFLTLILIGTALSLLFSAVG